MIVCVVDNNFFFIQQFYAHHVRRFSETHSKHIKSTNKICDSCGRMYGYLVHFKYLDLTLFLVFLCLGSSNYILAVLITSAKTPDAVTSAPAPAPFTTNGCSG